MSRNKDLENEIVHGTIAYPFVTATQPLGVNEGGEKFVIKSAVGNTEYTVEIPGAARDYDVEVPLAAFEPEGGEGLGTGKRKVGSPVATDQELTAALPSLERDKANDTAVFDSAFGVGSAGGPTQSPSYSLGIARVFDLYKQRQFSYALIEINNLLAFYPNSPKLLKMKGTILVKLQDLPLAELAWIRALELTPHDQTLHKALNRLQKRIKSIQATASDQTLGAPSEIPQPVGTAGGPKEDPIAH